MNWMLPELNLEALAMWKHDQMLCSEMVGEVNDANENFKYYDEESKCLHSSAPCYRVHVVQSFQKVSAMSMSYVM